MANRRVLVKRRKAIRNIRKITRTMELIATARSRRRIDRAVGTKPYTEKLAELVADLSRAAGSVNHPLLDTHERCRSPRWWCSPATAACAAATTPTCCAPPPPTSSSRRRRASETDVHWWARRASPTSASCAGHGRADHRIDDKLRFDQVEPLANR